MDPKDLDAHGIIRIYSSRRFINYRSSVYFPKEYYFQTFYYDLK